MSESAPFAGEGARAGSGPSGVATGAPDLETPQAPRRIFLSYSHDSEEHRAKVLALAQRLRRDGLDARLDRYVEGTPMEGWPRWVLDQIDAADFVLAICTETYYRRFRGHEAPGFGRGADWEGALITREIHDDRSRTVKFVPVLLSAGQLNFIPEPLRSHTFYELTSEEAYQALYSFLVGQAGHQPGPLGSPLPISRPMGQPLTFSAASESSSAPAVPGTEAGVEANALRHPPERAAPPVTPRRGHSLLGLALPTLVVLPLVALSTKWHVPTRIRLEVPTSRLALTVAGDAPQTILAPGLAFSSLLLERCGTVSFRPASLAVANPQDLIPAAGDAGTAPLAPKSWRPLTLAGDVRLPCSDPGAKVTVRAARPGSAAAGTLGEISFAPGARVILEALSGTEPALSVEVDKPLRLSIPAAPEVELVTDLVRPAGIAVPYSGDLITYRARLAEPRTRIEVESGAQGLVLLVTPTAGRRADVFADRLELPVSEVELLGEDRDGKPGSRLVGTATLSYPGLAIAPVEIGEDEALGLRGLAKAQLSSLQFDAKDRSKVAIRARFDGVVTQATTKVGDFREERCLTLYQRVRSSWRWVAVTLAAVWLLSTSWAAVEVMKKLRE